MPVPGQWLEGLDAAVVGAGDQAPDRVAGEPLGHALGLAAAALVEGPVSVVTLPLGAPPRPPVADEEGQGLPRPPEGVEDGAVAVVGDLAKRVGQRQPADLVHLLARLEATPRRGHRPVADDLRPAPAILIGGRGELDAQEAGEPGLFGHLPERALLVRFVPVHLPLGQGPVAVARAMDQQDLAAPVRLVADDGAAGGANDLRGAHARSGPRPPDPLTRIAVATPPSLPPGGSARRRWRPGPDRSGAGPRRPDPA